jgi:hypothetical protein
MSARDPLRDRPPSWPDPGEDQIGQFGRHLCGIAEGWDDIILVIPSGRDSETLPENRREAGSRQYVPETMTIY